MKASDAEALARAFQERIELDEPRVRPNGLDPEPETEASAETAPARRGFPESAWRGPFGTYREAMQGTTEASDVAHFASLWAAAAANLGRRVHMYGGDDIYPNVYLAFFGPTGDKKTTAMRRILRNGMLGPGVGVVPNVGSAEGLLDTLTEKAGDTSSTLFFWEEISNLMARGRWAGATIFETLTQIYDCPGEYGVAYRKNRIQLREPTPSIIAGTTADWFWKNARPEDFHGGFLNRFLFLNGARKLPVPHPKRPNEDKLIEVIHQLAGLRSIESREFRFSPAAERGFEQFYTRWETAERAGLYADAVKRIHVYVRKLAMTFAAFERTDEITSDQLLDSIRVCRYAAASARELIDSRNEHQPEGELETTMLSWVRRHDGVKKRYAQQTLNKVFGSADVFNRVVRNLIHADRIELRDGKLFTTG